MTGPCDHALPDSDVVCKNLADDSLINLMDL